MKKGKRFLALVLGGVMAAGSLFLQMPVMAQAGDDDDDLKSQNWQNWIAEVGCNGFSDTHLTGNVDVVDGLLTVTVNVQSASHSMEMCGGAVYVCEEEWEPASVENAEDGKAYYDFFDCGSSAKVKKFFNESTERTENGSKGSYKFIFEGLTVGKTYYVYCHIWDPHDISEAFYGSHYAVYLGSGVPTAVSAPGSSSSGNASSGSSVKTGAGLYHDFENETCSRIQTAEAGSTIVMDEGVTTLSNAMMKELLEKGDVSLRLEFTYEDKDYVIIIPAGAALDNDIPWYGPLYLAAHFGNSAGTENTSSAGGTYVVKSGDTLSKIAAANNMTLKDLLAKNPQIRDANKIAAGKTINL